MGYDQGFESSTPGAAPAPAENEDSQFAPPVVTLVPDAVVSEPEAADDPEPAQDETATAPAAARTRSERGGLEKQVEELLNEQHTDNGDPIVLTPHRTARLLFEKGLREKAPSSGAVSAVFDRWAKCGAAEFTTKPYAFVKFTDDAVRDGIEAVKAAAKEAKKSA